MAEGADRTSNFARLVELLQRYRGLSLGEIASRLGVDRKTLRTLMRSGGDPRLSVLRALADELDWHVESIVDSLAEVPAPGAPSAASTCGEAQGAAEAAYAAGNGRETVRHAQQMFQLAQTPEGQAAALNYESGGWNLVGLYPKERKVLTTALEIEGISARMQARLLVNRANADYELGDCEWAASAAERVIRRYRPEEPTTSDDWATLAHAHHIHGLSELRLLGTTTEDRGTHAHRAREALAVSRDLHRRVLAHHPERSWIRATMRTAAGGLVVLDVELGRISPAEGVEQLSKGLDRVDVPDENLSTHDLESLGRRCILAASVCERSLGGTERQRAMGLFLGKAKDIAQRIGHWALWERVFTLDYFRREAVTRWAGTNLDWPLDEEEVRVLAGVMSRFPSFRTTGWRILERARFVA